MQKTPYKITFFPLLLLLLLLASCNNKTAQKEKSVDLNEVQGKIEKDYYNALMQLEEYQKDKSKQELSDEGQAHLNLAISNILTIEKFDYKSERGRLLLELIYQISSVYNDIEFLSSKDLRPLIKSLENLNRKNDNKIEGLTRIIGTLN